MERHTVQSRPAANRKAALLIIMAGMIGIMLAMSFSLIYGIGDMQIKTIWEALFQYDENNKAHQIIHEVRLPRALAAAFAGAYLALSGAIMQAMTRNPLAEPSLLGVSYGAAFAIVVTSIFLPGLSLTGSTLVAMLGAGVAVLGVFLLAAAAKGGAVPVKLALAGVAIGMFLSSLTSILALHFDVAKEISFWYAGGLANTDWRGVQVLAIAGLIGLPLLVFLARVLTLLSLGTEVTQGLGINLKLVYTLSIFVVLLLTGSSVTVSGAIGFIGLVVPHISRMAVGTDQRLLLPVAAVLGSFLLILADVGARMIHPPFETPIGVVTAAIGVPFFLYLVRREGSKLA